MGRILAVSDLHGIYDLWKQIQNSLQSDDILYMLGDAADRGPDGWKIIKEALADPRVIYIRGNHDQMLLDCWHDNWRDNWLWFNNGGWETFDSIIQDENSEIYLIQLARTKLYHCYENKEGQKIHLSHAGFTLMENNEIPNREDLLWGREHIIDCCSWWTLENPNDYVVHGHSYCASRSCFGRIEIQLNDSKTVGRYCYGHKICIDGRSFITNKCALLDLDTLQETVFEITN
jgi:serine/threonine protein phosphatase 1